MIMSFIMRIREGGIMAKRYSRSNVRTDTDPHPTWDTHYLAEADVVDNWTGRIVETIKAFSTVNGKEAVKEVVDKADALIAELERQLPSPDAVFAAVCSCSKTIGQNNAHRDCVAQKLGIPFAPHVDRYCEILVQKGLVVLTPPFITLTTEGIAKCPERHPESTEE
jgi:hypothetical protein